MNITVLGAGLVGSAIVKDLARDPNFAVTAADINPQALEQLRAAAPITTAPANLQEPQIIAQVVDTADLVVCAVPGFMGFETVKTVIKAGKNLVDISFFPEDAFALDGLAQEQGVTAVVDCGVAPGLCNIMAGHASVRLDSVERYLCYVGGLPKTRRWPYEYKAVFSPADVLEEYTRPARFVENGRPVTRPALSDVELVDLPGVSTLEAFNTDGLRSLMRTLDAPFMKEKTLRYPGHANLMRVFRESGFFSTEPVAVNNQNVVPLEMTSQLLFDQWKLQPNEIDFTVMRVVVEGQAAGKIRRITFDLYDEYDPATATHSMARTTGYTAAIVARQVANGLFAQKGICPPEFVGQTPGCFKNLLQEYQSRNIQVRESTKTWGN